MENKPRYRSLFWPILLIGVGLVWLLSNLGYIQPVNIGALLRLWPIILIVVGVDIIFGKQFPWIGGVIGLLAVAGVIAFLIASPALGVQPSSGTITETFSAPLDSAKSVEYYFETSSEPVSVNAMDDSTKLISAEITHRGTINFDVSGEDSRSVHLSETYDNTNWLSWDFDFQSQKWDIGIAQDVPTEIILNGGSGSINMDLSDVDLQSLRTDLGSGSSRITLPAAKNSYTVEVDSGSGSVNLDIPEDADVELTLDSGSGSLNISVPDDAALRVEVDDEGSGSLSLPNELDRSADSDRYSVGAWQTSGYNTAEHKILIIIAGQGSGSVSIH